MVKVEALQTALSEVEAEAQWVTEQSTRMMISRVSAAEQMVRDAMELVDAAESARDCAEEEAAQRVTALRAEMHAALAAAERANMAKHASVTAMQRLRRRPPKRLRRRLRWL